MKINTFGFQEQLLLVDTIILDPLPLLQSQAKFSWLNFGNGQIYVKMETYLLYNFCIGIFGNFHHTAILCLQEQNGHCTWFLFTHFVVTCVTKKTSEITQSPVPYNAIFTFLITHWYCMPKYLAVYFTLKFVTCKTQFSWSSMACPCTYCYASYYAIVSQ